jgi:general secretion pathway protein D
MLRFARWAKRKTGLVLGSASFAGHADIWGTLRRTLSSGLCAAAVLLAGLQAASADGPQALGPPTQIQGAQPQAEPASGDDNSANAKIYEGSGEFLKARRDQKLKVHSSAGDITLDFADADVRDVVRSVLGGMLKVPYVIDPQVTGHLTLKTGSPILSDAVVPALETALKTVGAAIVVSDGVYNVVPLSDAQKQSSQISAFSKDISTPGYGIEVVPLRYISATEMQKIIEPLAPPGAILRVDAQRNLVFLAGTEPERASIRDTIALFDVDYLKGMSFALIQPQHVDAGTLATELSKIFDETSSPIAGLVRMIPISRINTLLVVTARPSYLREVNRWVSRLDVVPVTPGRQLHFYKLENARAADIAQTLGEVFGTSMPTAQGAPAQRQQEAGSAPQPPSGSAPTTSSPSQPAVQAFMPPPGSARAPAAANGSADAPQIVTDEINNALIIRADAAEYDAIVKIIRQMDVTPDQVMIEVSVVEVTLNDTLQYGVEWYFKSGSQTYGQSQTGTPTASFPGFGFTYNVPNVSAAMSALGSLTKINVVSSPKLLTLDNMPATIDVGDQVPVVSQTAVSTSGDSPIVSTVQQLSTGVILSVTPRIGASGVVYLTVAQEVSEAVPTTTGFTQSPTIQQRKLQTTVAIGDGNTVALGGMIRRTDTSGNSGIPYLKDIPGLGALFGSQNDTRERTELLVFLTPRVVRSAPAAAAVTEDLRKALDGVRAAMTEFEQRKDDIPRMPWR